MGCVLGLNLSPLSTLIIESLITVITYSCLVPYIWDLLFPFNDASVGFLFYC